MKATRILTGKDTDPLLHDNGKDPAATALATKYQKPPPTTEEFAKLSTQELYDLYGARYPKISNRDTTYF